jgi:hypothetical protein
MKKCCRSTPRCRDCPVLVLAAARRRREEDAAAALVREILTGRPPRELPPAVALALEQTQPRHA